MFFFFLGGGGKVLRHRFRRSTIRIQGASACSSALELQKKLLVAGAFGWRTSENVNQMSFASTQMKCYSAPTENEKSGVRAKQGQKMKEALLKFDIPFSIESCLDLRSHKDPHKVYPRKSHIESQNHHYGKWKTTSKYLAGYYCSFAHHLVGDCCSSKLLM